jgi:UDP-glucose 4-epimerase
MSVMVTGAAGFIGSHLVDRLLAEGGEVIGVDDLSSGSRANLTPALSSDVGRFEFHEIDVTSGVIADLIASEAPEVIFHLAAQVDVRKSVADPVHDARLNIIGTLQVLQAAARAGTRKVVFTSSGGAIYGEPTPDRLPVTEDQVWLEASLPESPYGVSKKVMLDYLRYFKNDRGLDFSALALSNVYGPRQEPAAEVGLEGQVVAIFCRRMLSGRPCTIYGDGSQTRDFVYVDDVVGAFASAAGEAGRGDLINVSSSVELSVNELHSALAELSGSSLEPVYAPPRPGELNRIVVDSSKAARVLGWRPTVPLQEGLERTLDYFRAAA